MKLTNIDFYLDWPRSIKVVNLRKFIIENLVKKGKVIRWSIIEIQDSEDSLNMKKIKINAVFAN